MWLGPTDGSGYGWFTGTGWAAAAHRIVYATTVDYAFGRLRHTCGVRACVNPGHLVEEDDEAAWKRRFRSKIAFAGPAECWLWVGTLTKAGYGVFYLQGKTVYAHRLAWDWLRTGDYEWVQAVIHTCGNRACVNPRHLVEGRERGGKLDEDDVAKIRAICATGISQSRVAVRFGISPSMVSRIVSGTRWPFI